MVLFTGDSPTEISFDAASGLSSYFFRNLFNADSIVASSCLDGYRAVTERQPKSRRSGGVRPCSISRSPKCRAASTNCTSFIVTSACKGVSVRSRRVQKRSREGASNVMSEGGGAVRFQKVDRK